MEQPMVFASKEEEERVQLYAAWKNCREEFTEIAEELAARNLELERMRHRIECLRGALKSASGWFLDLDALDEHEKCLEMAGDMEPLEKQDTPDICGKDRQQKQK